MLDLQSAPTEESLEATIRAIEYYHGKGWTDGLPIIPPTEGRVREFLEVVQRRADEVVGTVVERRRRVTVGKIATNAVMAGCLPEHFPVVLTAIEAAFDDAYCIGGSTVSTNGVAVLTIVNGPVVQRLQMNPSTNVLGPGNRANATIGRAIRLVLINCCAAIPGLFDRSTFGNPGKYCYVVPEDEEVAAFEPFHVSRGFDRGASVVTVMAAQSPMQCDNRAANRPEGILETIADAMSHLGTSNLGSIGEFAVVLSPEHSATIKEAGWSRQQVQQFLYDHAGRSVAEFKRVGRTDEPVRPGDETTIRKPMYGPHEVLLVTAGGRAGRYSLVIPCWSGSRGSRAISRQIPE